MDRFFCPKCGSLEHLLNTGDHSFVGECSKCELYFSVGYSPSQAPFEPDPEAMAVLKEQMGGGKP